MNLTVILVNWNQSETTLRCLQSLLEHTRDEGSFVYRAIVVDNASSPAEIAKLEKGIAPHSDWVTLLKHATNAGFAGGNNIGIRHALRTQQPDYIWLLNNDIIVQEGALNALVAAARKYPKIKIWGSTIYELHPTLHFHCAGGFRYNALFSIPTPIRLEQGRAFPKGIYHPLPEMDYPAGASMFVKSEVFIETGLMNEMYFLYYEELDLVRQIGGRKHLAWCPDSVLHHESGKSTGSQNPNDGRGSWIAHYYGNLSALKYTWRYHRLYFPVVYCFRLLSKSVLFLLHRDFRAFAPLLKAYSNFFRRS